MDSGVILPNDLPDKDGFVNMKPEYTDGDHLLRMFRDDKVVERKQKLEQYAWELVKLKCDKTCDKDALIVQAYELAEKFLKQTEEKFN